MNALNKYFNIEQAIGKELTEDEFMCLMSAKRLWTTTARFGSFTEAHAAIGGELSDFNPDSHNVYGGLLITDNPDDFEEAQWVAKQRGWDEEVDGVLHGIISCDHEMINPYDIKNLN